MCFFLYYMYPFMSEPVVCSSGIYFHADLMLEVLHEFQVMKVNLALPGPYANMTTGCYFIRILAR